MNKTNRTYKTNKTYAVANIKIPIEVNEDGSFEALPEYMSILFDNIEKLPNPSENDYNNQYIKNQILALLEKEESTNKTSENCKTITHLTFEELKNRNKRSHKKDITFKNNKSSISRYTRKNYFKLEDKGAVQPEQPTAQE